MRFERGVLLYMIWEEGGTSIRVEPHVYYHSGRSCWNAAVVGIDLLCMRIGGQGGGLQRCIAQKKLPYLNAQTFLLSRAGVSIA